MQAMVSSPVNGRQKPASEMKLSDDVIKSCSVVQELSWPQKNVEIGSVKQSDDTVKPWAVVDVSSFPLEGEEVMMAESSDVIV